MLYSLLIMPIISREREDTYGEVIQADVKSRIPFFAGAFYPACCLEDTVKYRAKLQVQLKSGDGSHELKFKASEHQLRYWRPKVGDLVPVASTTFKFFGLTLPLISRSRLLI